MSAQATESCSAALYGPARSLKLSEKCSCRWQLYDGWSMGLLLLRERENEKRKGQRSVDPCVMGINPVMWPSPAERQEEEKDNETGERQHCHGDLLTWQCLLTSPNLTVLPRGHAQALWPLSLTRTHTETHTHRGMAEHGCLSDTHKNPDSSAVYQKACFL